MTPLPIQRIAIDETGRLVIQPELSPGQNLASVYRSAMGVHWDDELRALYCPRPKNWSYVRWFKQAVAAVASEYGLSITIVASTNWVNVPNEIQTEIRNAALQAPD